MSSEFKPQELANKNGQLRDISIIAGRNIKGLLGIADWIEEAGQPRKADAVRVIAYQLDEVVGEIGAMMAEAG